MFKTTKYNIIIVQNAQILMLEKETKILFDLMTNNNNINKAIRVIANDIFDNAVMVTNSYFHVVDMSTNKYFEDQVWDYARKYHCCSKESILSFKEDEASNKLFSSNSAFLYDTNLGKDIPRILGRIVSGEIVYGYLIVFEVNHKLNKKDIDKANLVCKALAVLMSNVSSNDSAIDSRKNYFYKQLLNTDSEKLIELENEISQFQWDFKRYFKVLSIKNKDYESHYTYLSNLINQINSDVDSFVYENQIIVVSNFKNENDFNKIINSILNICKEYDSLIGVSRTFINLYDLKIYEKQAHHVREIGLLVDGKKDYYRYSQYEYYDMLARYDKQELNSLISREYLSLKQYDLENKTDLLETAVVYFLCGLNVTKASNQLHIHRNTLMYRLKQIEDITNINLNDDVENLDLIYHSKMIDKYLNVI